MMHSNIGLSFRWILPLMILQIFSEITFRGLFAIVKQILCHPLAIFFVYVISAQIAVEVCGVPQVGRLDHVVNSYEYLSSRIRTVYLTN